MPTVRRYALACTLFVCVWGLAACGDSLSSTSVDGEGDQARRDRGSDRPRGNASFLLVPAGSKSYTVSRSGSKQLKVFLYDQSNGNTAAKGEVISFQVVDGSTGTLSSKRAETNDEGAASVRFDSKRVGRSTIRVNHSGADPLDLTVRSIRRPKGSLQVEVVNTGDFVMSLSDVTVRLYKESNFDCKDFEPLDDRQPEGLANRVKAKPGTTADFGERQVRRSYTVAAVARGERGQIAAGGCQDGISLERGEVTEEELLLNLIPLRPEGRYLLQSEWDFEKVLAQSGAVGKNVTQIFDIFQNPGKALYDEIMNLIGNYVSSIVQRGLDWFLDQTGLDKRIQNTINRSIQNNEVLCKIREAGRDLRDVVANLQVRSELTIGRVQSKYTFQGRDNWLGITFYWRGKCKNAYEGACSGRDKNSAEQRQRKCAAIHLTADSNGNLGELGVVSSKWTGRITAYNTLKVDQHPLPLRYGRLVKYVLNQIILPDLTNGNANSLTGAFSHWLGCKDLARSVTGSNGKVCAVPGACIEDDRIKGFCKSSIKSLFSAADLVVGGLEYDTDIFVGGKADLVEASSDGRVDYIENGVYRGYLSVGGSPDKIFKGRSDVRATWRGERVSSSTSTK